LKISAVVFAVLVGLAASSVVQAQSTVSSENNQPPTDSVGGDAMNQALSEQRANSVRDYLAKQNIPMASMTARGLGMSQPVASNDTTEGRQQNRRVEMIVSGDTIGTTVGPVSEELSPSGRP
jgi:OmpA family